MRLNDLCGGDDGHSCNDFGLVGHLFCGTRCVHTCFCCIMGHLLTWLWHLEKKWEKTNKHNEFVCDSCFLYIFTSYLIQKRSDNSKSNQTIPFGVHKYFCQKIWTKYVNKRTDQSWQFLFKYKMIYQLLCKAALTDSQNNVHGHVLLKVLKFNYLKWAGSLFLMLGSTEWYMLHTARNSIRLEELWHIHYSLESVIFCIFLY